MYVMLLLILGELTMPKIIPDLEIGAHYGDWVILQEIQKPREKYYLCQCKCGTTKEVSKSNLRLGKSTNCNKGSCKSLAITHGATDTRLYGIWCGIKARLKNPIGVNECYTNIRLHPEWEVFENFQQWANNNGYSDDLTIDRIDGTKDYEPCNCRWVTSLVQSQNRRKHKTKKDDLPKGIYKSSGHRPYYWIVIYNSQRYQRWGFNTPEEAYQDRLQFIKDNFDGLVYPD